MPAERFLDLDPTLPWAPTTAVQSLTGLLNGSPGFGKPAKLIAYAGLDWNLRAKSVDTSLGRIAQFLYGNDTIGLQLDNDGFRTDVPADFNGTGDFAGNFSVGGTKFVVTAADGSLNVGPNKFTVAGLTGNTSIAGTLAVTGTSVFTGQATFQALVQAQLGLNVTGAAFSVGGTNFQVDPATGAVTMGGNLIVDTNVLYVDVAGNRVGINKVPGVGFDLDVNGPVALGNNVTIDTNLAYFDAAANRIYLGYTSEAGSYLLNVNGAMVVKSTIDVITGDVSVDNNRAFLGADTGGAALNLVKTNASNKIEIGDIDHADWVFAVPGPSITGSRSSGAALLNLLAALDARGLIQDNTTA